MNKVLGMVVITFVAFLLAPMLQQQASGGYVKRLVNEFAAFEGDYFTTDVECLDDGLGGYVIYEKTVKVNAKKTLYITLSGCIDTDGYDVYLSCLVDGVPANPGQTSESYCSGWIVALPAEHDGEYSNAMSYTWCTELEPQPKRRHTVQLRIATEDSNQDAYIEGMHILIDSAVMKGGTGCQKAEIEVP